MIELSSEATEQLRLKIAVIAASVHQVRRSDADQPFKGAQLERSTIVPVVLESPTVLYTWDMGETVEEAI